MVALHNPPAIGQQITVLDRAERFAEHTLVNRKENLAAGSDVHGVQTHVRRDGHQAQVARQVRISFHDASG